MKTFAFGAVALLSFASVAEARPSTYNMTCSQARDMVRTHGAIVMNYGYSDGAGHLYDRFVAHGGYCSPHEETRPFWARTRDSGSCFIGYTCESRSDFSHSD